MKKKMVWLAGCLMAAAAVLTGCDRTGKGDRRCGTGRRDGKNNLK